MIINVYYQEGEKLNKWVSEANMIAMSEKLDVHFHPIQSIEEYHQKKYEYMVWIGKKRNDIQFDDYIRTGSAKKLIKLYRQLQKRKSKVIQSSNYHKNSIIAVVDGKDLAFGIALSYSKNMKLNTVLVDANRMMPHYDSLFNNSGPNLGFRACIGNLKKASQKSLDISKFTQRNMAYGSLEFLTSSPHLYSYELEYQDEFNTLLQLSVLQYNRVILRINPFIYDAFTLLSLIKADVVIVPITSDIEEIRNYHHLFDYISEKQGISKCKVFYTCVSNDKINPSTYLNFEKQWLGNYSKEKKAYDQLVNKIEEK